MENNISEQLQKELEKILASRFFFRPPSNTKVVAYSVSFLLLAFLGSILSLEVLAAFLAVFPLTYVLGAKGLKAYLPLSVFGIGILAVFSSPSMIFWFVIHIAFSYLLYHAIKVRYSKIFLVSLMATLLFLAIAFYIVVLIRYGYININAEKILEFINSYVDSMMAANQTLDKNLILSSFENMQKTFPVTLFVTLFIYVLVMLKYTLAMLSVEGVIIPVFPKFSNIVLSTRMGYIYIGITIIDLLVRTSTGDTSYDFWALLLENLSSILAYAFVLNGLFTAFFFAEKNSNSGLLKVLAVVGAIVFSPIFELVGFVDSMFKLRESYIIMKKGE